VAVPRIKKITRPNAAGIEVICSAIDKIADNFYGFTAEDVETKLSAAVSKLYKKKLIKPGPHFDFSFRSALRLLLRGGYEELLDDAEKIEGLIDNYIDEPSEEDMEEALELMLAIKEKLKELLPR
jgi:hypothetical protein